MRSFLGRIPRIGLIAVPVLQVLTLLAVAVGAVRLPWQHGSAQSEADAKPQASSEASKPKEPGVELVAGSNDSLRVPDDVRRALGIRSGNMEQVAVTQKPTRSRPLTMSGSTALDPARLLRVRVRFTPAEVVQIGTTVDPHCSPGDLPPLRRGLQVGDPVKKGDLLAVVSSVEVGNKKNDLLDALVQLRLDEEVLRRAEAKSSAVPEVFLLNARRNVQTDMNAVNRAENTLKAWGIPEADLKTVHDAVPTAAGGADHRAGEKERLGHWSKVELRAPDDGFVLEQNVALHETVVDNSTNLFQIAKVDALVVLAAAAEDDLPALQAAKVRGGGSLRWTVQTVGSSPIAGLVDDIGYLIDPNQHTAVVRGHIPNPGGALRAGQFVTATVELPPPVDVVEVPIGAVVEDGHESIVFVQADPGKPVYTMRRVQVTNRFERTAYVRSVTDNREPSAAGDDGPSPPTAPLHEGERVLTTGSLELKTALADKLSERTSSEAAKAL